MAYHSTNQRTQRVLSFLGALSHPEMISRLAPFGLDEAVINQGWKLLRAQAQARPAPRLHERAATDLLTALDTWENRWFPIADASLRHRHPEIHRQLFLNLGRTRGLKVIVSVGSFVERMRELRAGTDHEARAACTKLEARGLHDATLKQAEALLAEMQRPARPSPQRHTQRSTRAHARETEQAMWRWYREWSQISRAVIQEPESLRYLGFGVPGRPRGGGT